MVGGFPLAVLAAIAIKVSEPTLATTGGVTVDGVKVITADIVADDGVIHVIDTVLMPN